MRDGAPLRSLSRRSIAFDGRRGCRERPTLGYAKESELAVVHEGEGVLDASLQRGRAHSKVPVDNAEGAVGRLFKTVHVIGIERLRPEILGRELDHDGDGTIARHDGRTERSPTVPSASSTGTLEWARRL